MIRSGTLAEFKDSGHTLGNADLDFVRWHRGRPFYFCWLVMVETPDWTSALRRAASRLRPWLVPGYARQGHVTILPGGFPGQGSLDITAIRACARRIQPFGITLGPLGSFTSSPCFEVLDPGAMLNRLRGALRPVLSDPLSQVSDSEYRPHLTVGLYRERFATGGIAKTIAAFPAPVDATMRVESISLCAYDARSIKGPLSEAARVELGSGRVEILGYAGLFRQGSDD